MSKDCSPILSIAWISRGRLFVKREGGDVQEIESDFAKNSLERELRHSSNNAWKDRSGVWGNMGMAPPGMAPWASVDAKRRIRFVTAAKGDSPDEIYYVLDLGAVGGLFKYNMELDEETRLVHSQSFTAQDISRHPENRQIAVSVRRDDGTMGLSINRHDGLYGKLITLSDTIDEAPSWLPDGSRRLLFQSSAIGRNDDGVAIGKSTCRVELLDLEAEEITKLHEEERLDLLQPRMTADETVLFIRRPYKSSHREPPTLWEVTQDVFLFPFRLARTFVHLFNFLSMAVSGKPLITPGGPERESPSDKPFLMLYGQAVDTRKAMDKGVGKDADRPLVPKEWELVSKTKAGDETVIAQNVLAFDVTPSGHIVYSDGRTIFSVRDGGRPQKIGSGDVIQKVVILS
ncbi:MAG: hypothetical protein R3C59_08640 [Planctomycetaceae bacterium]